MPALIQSLAALVVALNAYAASTTPVVSNEILIAKWANHYDVSATKMTKLMICESGGNQKIINPDDVGSPSYGLFQYKQGTFDRWAKEIGEEREIMNGEAQIRLTAYAISKNRQSHWLNCAKKVGLMSS